MVGRDRFLDRNGRDQVTGRGACRRIEGDQGRVNGLDEFTELRGPQDPDSWGQWIELHNATGSDLDLEGTLVDLQSIGGSIHDRILVRRSLPIDAGAYVVLGDYPDDDRPDHVDYGFGNLTSANYPKPTFAYIGGNVTYTTPPNLAGQPMKPVSPD